MKAGLWLTPEEVADLTGAGKPCKRRDTQCRRLAEMGIPFTVNYGGRPLVERSAVVRQREKATKAAPEPNWGAMGKVA